MGHIFCLEVDFLIWDKLLAMDGVVVRAGDCTLSIMLSGASTGLAGMVGKCALQLVHVPYTGRLAAQPDTTGAIRSYERGLYRSVDAEFIGIDDRQARYSLSGRN